jgi:hypothetical protein
VKLLPVFATVVLSMADPLGQARRLFNLGFYGLPLCFRDRVVATGG